MALLIPFTLGNLSLCPLPKTAQSPDRNLNSCQASPPKVCAGALCGCVGGCTISLAMWCVRIDLLAQPLWRGVEKYVCSYAAMPNVVPRIVKALFRFPCVCVCVASFSSCRTAGSFRRTGVRSTSGSLCAPCVF